MSRQAYKPTEGTRAQVIALSGLVGLPQDEIATYLKIAPKTLRKHYADELRTATVDSNCKVAGALFDSAMAGNTAAQIFWLKARGKWSEKVQPEGDAEPMPVQVVVQVIDASIPRAEA